MNICSYCRKSVTDSGIEVEIVTPISKDIMPICRHCIARFMHGADSDRHELFMLVVRNLANDDIAMLEESTNTKFTTEERDEFFNHALELLRHDMNPDFVAQIIDGKHKKSSSNDNGESE